MKNLKIVTSLFLMGLGNVIFADSPVVDVALVGGPVMDIAMAQDDSFSAPSVDYDAENDYEFDEDQYRIKDLERQPANINFQDKQGRTLLMMIAAQENEKNIMKFALQQLLANPNLQDRKGQSTLHYAIMSGDILVVKLLLQSGANIDLQDHEGKTPLYLAVENNYVEIANLLLQQGAQRKLGIFENESTPADIIKTPAMRAVFKNN